MRRTGHCAGIRCRRRSVLAQRDARAQGGCRAGDGEALLPARPVGDVAHRIDRFVSRTGRDQYVAAVEWAVHRIDVEGHGHLGPGDLDLRDVDDVAPDQQALHHRIAVRLFLIHRK